MGFYSNNDLIRFNSLKDIDCNTNNGSYNGVKDDCLISFKKLCDRISLGGNHIEDFCGIDKIMPHVYDHDNAHYMEIFYDEFLQLANHSNSTGQLDSGIEWLDKTCIEALDTYKYPSKEQLVYLCKLVMRFIFTGIKPDNLMIEMLLTVALLGCDPNDINQLAFKKLFSEQGTKNLPYINDLVDLALSITDSQEVLGEKYPGTGRINAAIMSYEYNYKISCYYYLVCGKDELFKMLVARLSHICLIFCRLFVKNISSVKYAFPTKSNNLFKSIYKSLSFSCPVIQINQNVWTCLESSMMKNNLSSVIRQICREITNETGEPSNRESQMKKYFESSCLQQFYCNGMPIFTLPIVIANKYKVHYRTVVRLFLEAKEYFAVKDITRMLRWLKSNKSQTWPFARLISNQSFSLLSAKRNPKVYAKLLALLDDDNTQSQDSILNKVAVDKTYVNLNEVKEWAFSARRVLRKNSIGGAETFERNSKFNKWQKVPDFRIYENFMSESIIQDVLSFYNH